MFGYRQKIYKLVCKQMKIDVKGVPWRGTLSELETTSSTFLNFDYHLHFLRHDDRWSTSRDRRERKRWYSHSWICSLRDKQQATRLRSSI